MYDDNENFKLDDDFNEEDENESSTLSENFVNLIENGSNDEEETRENTIDVTTELDVNRKNREGYEQLMKESSTKLDGYWDVNDPFIKILLIALLIFIVIGSILVFGSSLGN